MTVFSSLFPHVHSNCHWGQGIARKPQSKLCIGGGYWEAPKNISGNDLSPVFSLACPTPAFAVLLYSQVVPMKQESFAGNIEVSSYEKNLILVEESKT